MNDLENLTKREYYFIKSLEISIISIIVGLLIYFIVSILPFGSIQSSSIVQNALLIYGISFLCLGFLGGTFFWRLYRIPPSLQAILVSYYTTLGYTTKKSPLHTLKVHISPHSYFKVKINLHKRVSGESCLFYLESMPIPIGTHNKDHFNNVAERFFLKPNSLHQKISTTCEIEELYFRSLLIACAIEELTPIKI